MIEPVEAWAVRDDGGLVPMEMPHAPGPTYVFELIATSTFTSMGVLVFFSDGRVMAIRCTKATVTSGDTLCYTLQEGAYPAVTFLGK